MPRTSEINFIRQQGFVDAGADACSQTFPALMFQPKVLGTLVAFALVVQSWQIFLLLSVILWWNSLVPSRNPFDALYNSLVAGPGGLQRLTPAPAPRRFARGMAATFMLLIGISLVSGWLIAAWILEGLLVAALSALIFGKFCLGSYIYHLLRNNAEFANRTLPWSRRG
jgi:Domain of unknown function (DUF4395)